MTSSSDAAGSFPGLTRPAPYKQHDVRGEVVLITGASSGFGTAIAWRFAQLGAKLILVARRMDRLEALAAALKAEYGTQSHIVSVDVRDISACEKFVENLPADFAQVDILINNAGLALGLASAQDNDMEDMRTMLETNVLAVMALSKACLKVMLPRNKGHIINMGSTAGHEAYPGGSGYTASKFALNAYTTSMRHDLVGTNIRVTLISPGAVETEFSLVRFKGDKDRAAKVYEGMAKMVAEDIADNVVYVATRPPHVQINDIVVTSVHQSGAKYTARPLLEQQQK